MQLKNISTAEVLAQQDAWCRNKNIPFTYEILGDKYGSQKLILAKMEQLDRQGFLECGVSLRTAWLTEKGRELLKKASEPVVTAPVIL